MAKKYPKISIVIPLYVKTPYFFESVEGCLELDYPNYEILVGIDKPLSIELGNKKIKLFKTQKKRTGPAEKRDICIRNATGEYIAFLDDDSYPAKDWLKKAITHIKRKKVSSVCGPGITPPKDSFSQKLTGAILSSPFGSGPYAYRFSPKEPRYVDDYPAYNMIVRKKTLIDVGGFGTTYYGGEDTALCLKLVRAGEKIYYHPDIVVYHHRRSFPNEYAKQVGNVGMHRGYFVKKYPQTSLRFSYFAPAIILLSIPVLIFVLLIFPQLLVSFCLVAIFIYLIIFFEAISREGPIFSAILPIAVLANYIFYGQQFIKGLLFTHTLKR